MTYISRDPFARSELHRETVKCYGLDREPGKGCLWCGWYNRHGNLFRYYIEPDRVNYRRDDIPGFFCGIECMRTYYNIPNGR